jgi:Skp family chaperone for outer membrane proteins
MRQKITALFAFAFLILAVGCNQQAATSSPEVAVVDANKVLQESAPGKAAMAHLESIGENIRKELEPLQKDIKKDKTNQEAMQKFQKTLSEAQQLLNSEQDRLFGQLNTKFNERLESYRKAKGFRVVLLKSQVLAYDAGVDITDAMVKELADVKIDLETPADPGEDAAAALEAAGQDAQDDKAAQEEKAE